MTRLSPAFCLLLLSLLVPAPARAQDPLAEARRLTRLANEAHEAGDHAAFRDHLRAALDLRPNHPGLTLNLAAAYALNGQVAEALATLTRYAGMGLVARPEAEPAFAPVMADPGYAAVAARLEANRQPRGNSTEAFQLSDPRMVPEGIAYDPETRAFFVGSVHQRRIVRVDSVGREAAFAPAEGDTLWSVLGLAVDGPRRHLWAASAAMPQSAGLPEEERGRSGLFQYDLDTGRLVARYLLPADADGHALGDVTVHPSGDVYATDGQRGRLYVLRRGATMLETALETVLPEGALVSPQGLCPAADGRRLFLADYSLGLLAVDLDARTARPLRLPDGQTDLGIDGLVCAGDRLVAVQNGVRPHRVLRLALDAAGAAVTQVEVLEANNPVFDEPTLGVVVGSSFYFVANSQWSKFDDKGRLEEAGLRAPIILKVGI